MWLKYHIYDSISPAVTTVDNNCLLFSGDLVTK